MSSTLSSPHGTRRMHRDLGASLVGGVAAGLAAHLGWRTMWVRVGFVVASAASGLGAVLYVAMWLFVPADRTGSTRRSRPGWAELALLTVLAAALIVVVGIVVGSSSFAVPLAVGLAGVALLWRQADEAQRTRWVDLSGRVAPSRMLLGEGGWASWVRIGLGVTALLVSGALVALRGGDLAVARDVGVAAVLGVIGLAVVAGPWLVRLVGELADERAERVRSQEREEFAAHLHDSVLQTLALIQKSPHDAARLARAQERDLRSWLYDAESRNESTFAGAVRAAAAEIEDGYGISVDVVTVADRDLNPDLEALVAASREAIVNACKHAGVDRVDVYAEAGGETASVFVRDRGAGFDADAQLSRTSDRLGIRGSIVARMERHGGRAEIESAPGAGTEVRLTMPQNEASQETGEAGVQS